MRNGLLSVFQYSQLGEIMKIATLIFCFVYKLLHAFFLLSLSLSSSSFKVVLKFSLPPPPPHTILKKKKIIIEYPTAYHTTVVNNYCLVVPNNFVSDFLHFKTFNQECSSTFFSVEILYPWLKWYSVKTSFF